MVEESFGKSLKRARERCKKLSQAKLAERMSERGKVEISQQQISQWECDTHLPKDRFTFLLLCATLQDEGSLTDKRKINKLLAAAQEGALHAEEIKEWFPELVQQNGRPHSDSNGTSELEDEDRDTGREENESGNDLGQPPRPPVPPSGEESPNDPPWHRRMVEWINQAEERWGQPDQYGALAAIALTMLALGTVWQYGGEGQSWKVSTALLGAMWVSSALLAVSPSRVEQDATDYPLWRLKLFRFSGTASGVMVTAGMLWWLEGLFYLFFGGPIPAWLLYLLIIPGMVFAYGGGLDVQYSCYRRRNEEGGRERFYTTTSAQVAGMMLLAQAFFAWWNQYVLSLLPPNTNWLLLVVTPILLMLWYALRQHWPRNLSAPTH